MTQTEQREIADKVRAMAIFCLERKGKCWQGWNPAKVFRFLAFCYLCGTVFTIYDGAKIKALAIVFRVTDEELKNEGSIFDWCKTHEHGQHTLVCDVFGDKKEMATLYSMACDKWPEMVGNPLFTFRKGVLKQIPERMYR